MESSPDTPAAGTQVCVTSSNAVYAFDGNCVNPEDSAVVDSSSNADIQNGYNNPNNGNGENNHSEHDDGSTLMEVEVRQSSVDQIDSPERAQLTRAVSLGSGRGRTVSIASGDGRWRGPDSRRNSHSCEHQQNSYSYSSSYGKNTQSGGNVMTRHSRTSSRASLGSASRDIASVITVSRDIDWYGNNALHHAFATSRIDLHKVRTILAEFPESPGLKNQFGRIPLHYAVEKTRPSPEGIRLLVRHYPEGATLQDDNNFTPYDIAVKWEHPRKILRLLLEVDPYQDLRTYYKLKYGVFACAVAGCTRLLGLHDLARASAYESASIGSVGSGRNAKSSIVTGSAASNTTATAVSSSSSNNSHSDNPAPPAYGTLFSTQSSGGTLTGRGTGAYVPGTDMSNTNSITASSGGRRAVIRRASSEASIGAHNIVSPRSLSLSHSHTQSQHQNQNQPELIHTARLSRPQSTRHLTQQQQQQVGALGGVVGGIFAREGTDQGHSQALNQPLNQTQQFQTRASSFRGTSAGSTSTASVHWNSNGNIFGYEQIQQQQMPWQRS